MRFVLVVIGALLVVFAAFGDTAARCSNVSIDLKRLGPPRNQTDVGWCFAYVAADVATYYSGKSVSALDIAANYISKNEITGYSPLQPGLSGDRSRFSSKAGVITGGSLGSALQGAIDRGFCDESQIQSRDSRFFDLPGTTGPPLSTLTTAIYKLDQGYSKAGGTLSEKDCASGFSALRTLFPGADLSAMVAILKRYDNDLSWRKLTDEACIGKRTKLQSNPMVWVNNGNRPSQLADIDRLLNSKNIAAISYDYDHSVHEETTPWWKLWSKPKRTGHGSSVVARRFQNGRCEYLIRNTHGANCDPRFTKQQCSKGYFWLGRDTLKNHLISVTFLKKRP